MVCAVEVYLTVASRLTHSEYDSVGHAYRREHPAASTRERLNRSSMELTCGWYEIVKAHTMRFMDMNWTIVQERNSRALSE